MKRKRNRKCTYISRSRSVEFVLNSVDVVVNSVEFVVAFVFVLTPSSDLTMQKLGLRSGRKEGMNV